MAHFYCEGHDWIADYIDTCCREAWGAKWYEAVARFWEEYGKDKVQRLAVRHGDSVMAGPALPNDAWGRIIVREVAWHLYALANKEHGQGFCGITFDESTPPPHLETENGPDPISIDENTLKQIERKCSLRSESVGRDTLIDDLLHGRTTPEVAEAEAKKRGWRPLAAEPNPLEFDPLIEPYWTLTMSVAWIAWRRTNEVREYWHKFRANRSFFRSDGWRIGPDGAIQEGWVLKHEQPATLLTLMQFAVMQAEAPSVMTAKEALALLRKALQEGRIHASGIPESPVSIRCEIPALAWQDLEAYAQEKAEELEVFRPRPGTLKNGYLEVTVPATKVLELWPHTVKGETAGLAAGGRPPVIQPLDKSELAAGYKKRVAQWPADRPPPTPSEDWDFLKELWPKVTRDRARKLRGAWAPAAWKKAGRRSSSW